MVISKANSPYGTIGLCSCGHKKIEIFFYFTSIVNRFQYGVLAGKYLYGSRLHK